MLFGCILNVIVFISKGQEITFQVVVAPLFSINAFSQEAEPEPPLFNFYYFRNRGFMEMKLSLGT